jgi:putative heme-binding domain-containing protein
MRSAIPRTVLLVVALLAVVLQKAPPVAAAGAGPAEGRRAFGLDKRVPWTTSRLTGAPEAPPPYRTERLFPGLRFQEPVVLTRAPGSGRLFVVELRGAVYAFPDDPGCDRPDLVADLAQIPGHRQTYGLAFHPRFADNRQVFLCYVLEARDPKGSRVSRFTVAGTDPPRVDLQSEQILLEWPSGGHNGGCLQFGPDGYLYISTGDGTSPNPPDALDTGQDLGDLLASILRIDVDRPDPGKPYGIPADNPFVQHEGARPEVWAYGLRNPWKMAFDPKTGDLWVGDVGWEMWEMIYRVERGGNYGWSVLEGRQPVRPGAKRGPTPIRPPTAEHDHSESRSITGGRVYTGGRLQELHGAYVYGDYVTGKLWGLRHDGHKVTWLRHLADSALQIIDFGEGRDGELYVLDYGGTIHRLVPNLSAKANTAFPRRLSETGLFASVKDQVPAPGVLAYAINAEPWADHATAERYFAVPGAPRLGVYEKQNVQIGHVKGAWIYPPDTVFAKTLALELEPGNPASRRRLETQVLHRDGDTWRAYNYLWSDEQTDAVLAGPDGSDRTFLIRDPAAPGGVRQQTWHFASRAECLVCHTTRAGSILGFNVAQLNRDHRYGPVRADQLGTLEHIGLFGSPLPEPRPRLPDPFDSQESLNDRARAYLHTNCAHCHRRGGGGTTPFELLYEPDLKKLALVGTRPSQGAFDIPDAENVAAGDPYRSVLYYRMAKLGRGRMPYTGSGVVDERGLELIHQWIVGLPAVTGRPAGAPSVAADQRAALKALASGSGSAAERTAAVGRLLASTSGALYLLRGLDTGRVPAAGRQEILAVAAAHPQAPVRDLFERFVPEEQRVRRLGSVIKPADILALDGDAGRGRHLFRGPGGQCQGCHRAQGEGSDLGPDLSRIGQKYDRARLLESILEPSKVIEPAYVTHLVETRAGVVHAGLLVRRTGTEVVLRDAQGKVVTIPARDVEAVVPQPKSLMPELLVRDLTAQEVADLLAFLSSLR